MMMLFTPKPNTGAKMSAKDKTSFNKPQSSKLFSKALGRIIMVLMAPARKPMIMLMALEKACLRMIPTIQFLSKLRLL